METSPLDFLMHIDRHLADLVDAHPGWIYVLMALVLFAETGLIVMAMLPGDSLLFAAGALAASQGMFNLPILVPVLMGAVFAGDQINYLFGLLVGPRAFRSQGRILNAGNLDRARSFYARYGGEAIVLGRFIPLIRSVTPLAAAASGMPYRRFLAFSLPGSCLWAGLFLGLGYFLGNMDAIKGRFGLVLPAVLAATLLPGLLRFLVDKLHGRRAGSGLREPRRHRRGASPTP